MAEDTKPAGARPVFSNGGENGLTLWVNENKAADKDPDFTGYVGGGDNAARVAGWVQPAGEKDGKPYGAFVSLRASERDGDGYKELGTGTVQAWNGTEEKPLKGSSRLIGSMTLGGKEVNITGFATPEVKEFEGLAESLGFKGEIVIVPRAAPAAEGTEKRPSRKP